MRPLQWWAESAPPGGDRVKVSENLGATSVAPVAPVDTSLAEERKKGVWNNQNCYSNTYPVLCQRIVAYDYDCKYTKENCLENSKKESFTPVYSMSLG